MMKLMLFLLSFLVLSNAALAQKSRNFNGKRRSDMFGGGRDYRDITKHGLQISLGPIYTLTKPKNTTYSGTDLGTGRPMNSIIDPSGKFGAYINVGMAHYRLKESRFWGALAKKNPDGFFGKRVKSNLFHRFDWGLGFAYMGGKETTTQEYFSPTNTLVATQEYSNQFANGYLTGRFTADRFTQIGDNWHLETGIGVNFNYNILSDEKQGYVADLQAPLKFQKDFMAQIHGHIGFNYRVRKGDYLTFGFYIPAMGVYEWNKAKPTIQWFSSNYYPLSFQFQWIHHFTKRQKGCNTPGSSEDKKRNEEYMQNN
ncbi:MAG: hypothetical protein V4638_09510 [Bacteroidota bacterium]